MEKQTYYVTVDIGSNAGQIRNEMSPTIRIMTLKLGDGRRDSSAGGTI